MWAIIIVSFLYLAVMFLIAHWAGRSARKGNSLINNAYVYSLSLAVYCTAWTFYGSAGRAVSHGFDFLLIYIGPTIAAPLWWFVMRKIIRICKTQHITTLADFISSRYGKSVLLGGFVTIFMIIGIIPYIALQIKAITDTFGLLVSHSFTKGSAPIGVNFIFSIYIAAILLLFTIYYGTRNLETTLKNEGLVAAIAFESLFKLVAFLVVGFFVTFLVFNGFDDIFKKAAQLPSLKKHFQIETQSAQGAFHWFLMMLLSMLAVMFLPRQFQMMVIENTNENHLRKAMWVFPLYLLLINIFVVPIAFGGEMLFGSQQVNADTFVLAIPLLQEQPILAILAYLGGFAAATGMIIVSLLALSLMLSNNLIIPLLVKFARFRVMDLQKMGKLVISIRRLSIIFLMALAYLYLFIIRERLSLVSIGLISFVAVAQFAPAIIVGIYWKGATRKGAQWSILAGFSIWVYCLVLPTILNDSFVKEGPWGIAWLKPYEFLGLQGLEPIPLTLFWSLTLNVIFFLIGSAASKRSLIEKEQAHIFVDIFEENLSTSKSKIFVARDELTLLLSNFLGEKRSQELIKEFFKNIKLQKQLSKTEVNIAFIQFCERILAGVIGSAAARILINAITEEQNIKQEQFIEILKETKEVKEANAQLKTLDEQKNEFISTITHEMRTPITSIRAFSEILQEHTDLDPAQKGLFLATIIKETQRMERLIDQVLELEKFEAGTQHIDLTPQDIVEIMREALGTVQQIISENQIVVELDFQQGISAVMGNKDRLIQVILNLLSNAIKFANAQAPQIHVSITDFYNFVKVGVKDNGRGIAPNYQKIIFDKFYQAEDQTIRKPKGSGLGLAICKKIIQLHEGNIWVESQQGGPTTFFFTLPKVKTDSTETLEVLKPIHKYE